MHCGTHYYNYYQGQHPELAEALLPAFLSSGIGLKWLKYWGEWKGTSLDGPVWRLLIALDVPELMKILMFGHSLTDFPQPQMRWPTGHFCLPARLQQLLFPKYG
jgi:hypothetical protein